ncbi:MAG: T9SS type A sorting domain-containing protein, partial [Bacteroidota bacterium]
MTILRQQFQALRDGDRYYYENDLYLQPAEKAWIKATRLADVIRRNTSVTAIHDQVFMAQSLVSGAAENGNPAALDFLLFPNPATDHFDLQMSMEKPASGNLRVFDTSGRVVVNEEVELSQGGNRISVDLPAALPAGIYQVVLQANGKTGAQRLLAK